MKLQSFIVLLILFFVYRLWFSFSGTLSSGDWPYLYLENVKEFSWFPDSRFLWLAPYYQILTKIVVQYLGISLEIVERLLWFWPFLLLSIFSSYHLTKSWIGVLIYTTNTYILMVVSGGQMGIAMAYAIAPFILKKFMDFANSNFFLTQNKKIFKGSIILGLALAVLTMFDPRISYITMIAVTIYVLLNFKRNISNGLRFLLYTFLIPLGITVLVNFYWIIPLLRGNFPKEYQGLDNIKGFEFLSFADFSHTFGLLHPNWPENTFGKTYFMQPEFLLLPILAFSALLFKGTKNIYFFALLGLIGTFLAKGVNQPLGELNLWLFENFPGMSMFRDSSKFYLLIILNYSFLIPVTLEKLSKKIPFGKLLPIVFVLFWCILIRHALLGELGGTFKTRIVPEEYIELKQYIQAAPNSTVLWIPSRQRFGFSSNSHLGISALDILGNSDPLFIAKVISNDKDKAFYNRLKKMGVGYIVVPYDSEKELFIVDRSYSDSLRDEAVMELDKIAWLIRIPKFSKITVYRVQ